MLAILEVVVLAILEVVVPAILEVVVMAILEAHGGTGHSGGGGTGHSGGGGNGHSGGGGTGHSGGTWWYRPFWRHMVVLAILEAHGGAALQAMLEVVALDILEAQVTTNDYTECVKH